MSSRLLTGLPSRHVIPAGARSVHLAKSDRGMPEWFPAFRREKDFKSMDPALIKRSEYPGYGTVLDEPGVYPFPRDPPHDEAGATGPVLMSPGDARTLKINKASTGNVLDAELCDALTPQIRKFGQSTDVQVLFLVSKIPHTRTPFHPTQPIFSAGQDMVHFLQQPQQRAETLFKQYQLIGTAANCRKPFMPIMNGVANGAGASLAVAANLAGVTPESILTFSQTSMGLAPSHCATYFLNRFTTPAFGMMLALTGKRLRGHDIIHCGLATNSLNPNRIPQVSMNLESGEGDSDLGTLMHSIDFFEDELYTPYTFQPYLELIERCFGNKDSVSEIFQALHQEEYHFARYLIKKIKENSPVAVATSFRLMKEAEMHERGVDFLVNRELAEEAVAASLAAKTEKEEATQKKLKEKRQTRDISPVAPPLSKTAFVDLMMKGILLAREDSVRVLFRKYFQQQPSATAAGGAEPEHFELILHNQVREAMESIRRTSQETTEMYAKLRDFSHEEITNHCPGFADLPDTDPDQLALESVLSTLHLLSGAATSENAAAAAALVEQASPPPPSAPPALLSIREQLAALDTEEAQDSLIDVLVGSDDDELVQDAAGQIVDGSYSDRELSGDDAPVLGDDLSDLDLSDSDDLSSLLAIPEDSRKSVAVSDTSKGTEGFKKGHDDDDDEFASFAEDNELVGFDEAGEVNGEGSELEDEGAEEDADEEAQEEALSDIDCEDDETDIDELSQGPEHEYELSSVTNADDQSDDDDEETDEEGVKSFESIISQQPLPTLGNARDLIVNLASKQNLTLSNAMIEELASSAHQQLLQLRAEKSGDQVEGHSDGGSDEKAQEAGSASGLDDHEPDDLDDDDNEATDKPYLGVRLASRSDEGGHLFSLQTLAEAEFRTNMRLVQFPDFATAVHSRILKPTGTPPAWAIKDIADVPSRLVEDILAPFSDPQEELGEINQFSHLGHNLRSSMFARYRARLLAKPSEKKMMQFAERELFGGSHHC